MSVHLVKPRPSHPGSLQARITLSIQMLANKAGASLGGLSLGTQGKAQSVLEGLKDPRCVLAGRAGKVADEAADHLRDEKHESFRRWVIAGLEEPGAGRPHWFISDKSPPVGHTEHAELEDEDLEWGHIAMEARVAFWNKYWKGQDRQPDWPDWLEELR